jgi:hypothetical protein
MLQKMLKERLSFQTYQHGSTGRRIYFNITVEVTGLYEKYKTLGIKMTLQCYSLYFIQETLKHYVSAAT